MDSAWPLPAEAAAALNLDSSMPVFAVTDLRRQNLAPR